MRFVLVVFSQYHSSCNCKILLMTTSTFEPLKCDKNCMKQSTVSDNTFSIIAYLNYQATPFLVLEKKKRNHCVLLHSDVHTYNFSL